jgi:hypothetical protein
MKVAIGFDDITRPCRRAPHPAAHRRRLNAPA